MDCLTVSLTNLLKEGITDYHRLFSLLWPRVTGWLGTRKADGSTYWLDDRLKCWRTSQNKLNLWLSPSASRRRNPCSGPPPCVLEFEQTPSRLTFQKNHCGFAHQVEGFKNLTSGNLLRPLGSRTRISALRHRSY